MDAWKHGPYAAWTARYGAPDLAARRLCERPDRGLEPLTEHLPSVEGKKILNIMGSNGMKGIGIALLGGKVTVIDASEENARYCREVAAFAGVEIKYTVADVLEAPDSIGKFDIAFAELGIVHYFADLDPFARAIASFLIPGGTFLLRDFHPVSTKLLSYRGSTAKVRKYKVTGNYFDDALEEVPVPFSKHLDSAGRHEPVGSADGPSHLQSTVHWRKWTLGEIVSAFASSDFRIRRLIEEPNRSSESYDAGIPKTFTLVATRE